MDTLETYCLEPENLAFMSSVESVNAATDVWNEVSSQVMRYMHIHIHMSYIYTYTYTYTYTCTCTYTYTYTCVIYIYMYVIYIDVNAATDVWNEVSPQVT